MGFIFKPKYQIYAPIKIKMNSSNVCPKSHNLLSLWKSSYTVDAIYPAFKPSVPAEWCTPNSRGPTSVFPGSTTEVKWVDQTLQSIQISNYWLASYCTMHTITSMMIVMMMRKRKKRRRRRGGGSRWRSFSSRSFSVPPGRQHQDSQSGLGDWP